jgi:hypothetical protein
MNEDKSSEEDLQNTINKKKASAASILKDLTILDSCDRFYTIFCC